MEVSMERGAGTVKQLSIYIMGTIILMMPIAYAIQSGLNIDFERQLITTDIAGVTYTPQCKEICHMPLQISYFGTGLFGLLAPSTIELSREDIDFDFVKVYQEDDIEIIDVLILENGQWVSLNQKKTMNKLKIYFIDIIGIRTQNQQDKATDIIPIVYGKEFREYAWWNFTWEFFPDLDNESEIVFENPECFDGKTTINASAELPDNFWNLTIESDLIVTNDNEQAYYNFRLINFSKENQTGIIEINQCLDTENITVVYGVEQ